MKIYFKEYCYTQDDKDLSEYEYSIDSFEDENSKEKDCKYTELEIPDIYSDYEAEALCEKMVSELKNNGTPLIETLNKEVDKIISLIDNLKNYKSFVSADSRIESVHISVSLVNRGSFNDDRLISSLELKTEDMIGKPLMWTDLYLGKKNDNKIKIAPVYAENRELYLLEDNGEDIKVVKKTGFSKYYSDDFDTSHIIATEIYCSYI